ncbi:hypothetical protein C8E03_1294 [Lachnotalea glycerini]|uniref:Uncharacterized protein n=1 Tax=Lachnotalea glycerini TaxID=1763509 RepID=A0A318EG39_9FIRM|nr:hypothetical protein [Lachnotalea glycerini]PXV84493.1 hypothetical protein C8E03_1294 [Lachnotalea glycerini]
MTISITIYGIISKNSADWKKWYFDSKKICELLGYEANYLSITGDGITNTKIKTIKRSENKTLKMVEENASLDSFSIYVLPDNFTSAISDFTITASRAENYVTIIMDKSKYIEIDPKTYIEILQNHISMDYGEIYEMDIFECPEMYAAKVNDPSFYKTLHIIKKF